MPNTLPCWGSRVCAASDGLVDGAVRNFASSDRLVDDPPLVGPPGVHRVERRRFRCRVFAAVHSTRGLPGRPWCWI